MIARNNAALNWWLCFIIQGLLLGALSAGQTDAEDTTIEGRLNYDLDGSKWGGTNVIKLQYLFRVRLNKDGWNIRTQPVADPERYYEAAWDRENLYEYNFRTKSPVRGQASNGWGTIQTNEVPGYSGSMICFVWLAYASGEVLKSATNASLPPVWKLDDAFLRCEGFRVRATWATNSDRLGLPRHITMFDDGVLRWMDGSGRRFSERRAAPFDQGFKGLVYRALVITNCAGRLLPEQSETQIYAPLPNASATGDVDCIARIRISTETVRQDPEGKPLVPRLFGTTQVEDFRFCNEKDGNASFRYILTNSYWPKKEDPTLKALLTQRSATKNHEVPRNLARTRMLVLLLVVGSTLGLLALGAKLRRGPPE